MKKSTIEVVIENVIEESPQVKSFRFKTTDGSTLPRTSGGSHITTYV